MIITYYQLVVFFLIFARFSGMLIIAPFFQMRSMFALGKVALAFWASSLVMFAIPLPQQLPMDMLSFFLAMTVEIVVGFIIGFTANLVMSAIEFGGMLMDTQAGLSSASVLDPTSGKNAALLELLMKQLSVLLFLLMNGHHIVLSTIYESFSIIPLGQPVNFTQGTQYIFSLGTDLFLIGFQLAAPIILVIFLVDFSFGILNKVAEQINIFQMGFQLKPTVSVIIFLGIAPGFVMILIKIIETVLEYLIKLLGFFTL